MSPMEHSTVSPTEATNNTETKKVRAHGDYHFEPTTVPGLVGTGPILPEWLRKLFRRTSTQD